MNLRIGFIGFIFFSCITLHCYADKITGIVMDENTNKTLPFATISVVGSVDWVYTNDDGLFKIEALFKDSIQISIMGYYPKTVVANNLDTLYIQLLPQSYMLNEITASDKDELPLRYKSEVFPEGDPTLGHAIVSPLSYWYYKLSKKEKSKRKVRNLLDYETQMKKIMAIYNKELVTEFSGLSGTALDSCYAYCNANIDLNALDDVFSIKYKLIQTLSSYNRQKLSE